LDNRFDFKKPERISFQREIDLLFEQGKVFISHPLRVVYLGQKPFSGATVSVLIGVPKKKIKRAVERNRMKRLIREAYRLNKTDLIKRLKETDGGLLIAFLFIGNEVCRWDTVEESMQKAIKTLMEKTE